MYSSLSKVMDKELNSKQLFWYKTNTTCMHTFTNEHKREHKDTYRNPCTQFEQRLLYCTSPMDWLQILTWEASPFVLHNNG